MTVEHRFWSCLAGATLVAGCVAPVRLSVGGGTAGSAGPTTPASTRQQEAASAEKATPPGEAALSLILDRAGAYALRYGEVFRSLTAEERYRQWTWGNSSGSDAGTTPRRTPFLGTRYRQRTLRSDIVFVRLDGPIPWCTFRDVYRVDGRKVRDRDRRLERLFARPSPAAHEQARAILQESSRYNLAPDDLYHNVNSPTIALLFLLPENQARLTFEREGRGSLAGFPVVKVAFRERARPTLVRDRSGDDVPASGHFWIDPSRGTVLRTAVEYRGVQAEEPGEPPRVYAGVTTKYRREPALEIVVPDTMTDWYDVTDHFRIDGRADYQKYRRFQVTSEWQVVGGEKTAMPR